MIKNIFLDIARSNQIFFQDTATPTMSGIIDLHQHVFFFIIFIFIVVSFQIFDVLSFFRIDSLKILSIFSNNNSEKNLSSLNSFYNVNDEILIQQLIYAYYNNYVYTYVLDKFFEKDINNVLIEYVKTKYYFQLIKFPELFFNTTDISKIISLIKNLPLLTNNIELRKKMIIQIINLFLVKKSNKFKIFSSNFTTAFGGFSLFKNIENELKKKISAFIFNFKNT